MLSRLRPASAGRIYLAANTARAESPTQARMVSAGSLGTIAHTLPRPPAMRDLPVPRFDTFYRYGELTRLLFDYADAVPQLISVR